jgi:hypothetical protein
MKKAKKEETSKLKLAKETKILVEQYLADGGEITYCPPRAAWQVAFNVRGCRAVEKSLGKS